MANIYPANILRFSDRGKCLRPFDDDWRHFFWFLTFRRGHFFLRYKNAFRVRLLIFSFQTFLILGARTHINNDRKIELKKAKKHNDVWRTYWNLQDLFQRFVVRTIKHIEIFVTLFVFAFFFDVRIFVVIVVVAIIEFVQLIIYRTQSIVFTFYKTDTTIFPLGPYTILYRLECKQTISNLDFWSMLRFATIWWSSRPNSPLCYCEPELMTLLSTH